MYEVYFAVDGERNEEPEVVFETYEEAEDYAIAEQEKYSEDTYFMIYDVKERQWY